MVVEASPLPHGVPATSVDYSDSFAKIRASVVDSRGVRLADFVQTLRPKFGVVYRDIILGYVAIIASLVAMILAEVYSSMSILAIIPIAASVGYWIAFTELFLHEATHYNLARSRERNDLISNIFVGLLSGSGVAQYRKVHFQHHRGLGTVRDSERTYFFPLNLVFLVKSLLGIRVLEVFLLRSKDPAASSEGAGSLTGYAVLLGGMALHLSVLVALALTGLWFSALAWLLGVGMFYPFFAALRQLLEHRSMDARSDIDYSKTDHGAVTRIFRGGLFAETFGGAGFNRHLLHHWEPQVSYTRLPDLERFMLDTEMRPIMDMRETTYTREFWQQLRG